MLVALALFFFGSNARNVFAALGTYGDGRKSTYPRPIFRRELPPFRARLKLLIGCGIYLRAAAIADVTDAVEHAQPATTGCEACGLIGALPSFGGPTTGARTFAFSSSSSLACAFSTSVAMSSAGGLMPTSPLNSS